MNLYGLYNGYDDGSVIVSKQVLRRGGAGENERKGIDEKSTVDSMRNGFAVHGHGVRRDRIGGRSGERTGV